MSSDHKNPARATPERAARDTLARCRHAAGQISHAMTLVVLLAPIGLLLLPDGSVHQRGTASRGPSKPSSEPFAPPNKALEPSTPPASAPAPAAAMRSPLIPIIEVKVRRETYPRLDISAERETGAPPTLPTPPAFVAPAPAPTSDGRSAPKGADVTALLPLPPLPPAWTEVDVQSALRACVSTLAPLQAALEPRPPLKENTCGLPAPVAINRIGSDGVELRPAAVVVNCAMASALHAWLDDVAQPAARAMFGSPIARLEGTSGYACRNRNGAAMAPISEHAFGNAIDVSGFMLADGRKIGVLSHWGPTASDTAPVGPAPTPKSANHGPVAKQDRGKGGNGAAATPAAEPTGAAGPTTERSPEAAFLRRVHAGACGIFGTVLGPDANAAHRDHFHFDMKDRRRSGICE